MFDTASAGINLEGSAVMLGAVLLGLVAGVVARMLVPGDVFRNMTGPTSWLLSVAEDTRFELVRVLSQHAFQACALGL